MCKRVRRYPQRHTLWPRVCSDPAHAPTPASARARARRRPAALIQRSCPKLGKNRCSGLAEGGEGSSPIVRISRKKPVRAAAASHLAGGTRRDIRGALQRTSQRPARPALGGRAPKRSSDETPQSLIKAFTAQTGSPSALIYLARILWMYV